MILGVSQFHFRRLFLVVRQVYPFTPFMVFIEFMIGTLSKYELLCRVIDVECAKMEQWRCATIGG